MISRNDQSQGTSGTSRFYSKRKEITEKVPKGNFKDRSLKSPIQTCRLEISLGHFICKINGAPKYEIPKYKHVCICMSRAKKPFYSSMFVTVLVRGRNGTFGVAKAVTSAKPWLHCQTWPGFVTVKNCRLSCYPNAPGSPEATGLHPRLLSCSGELSPGFLGVRGLRVATHPQSLTTCQVPDSYRPCSRAQAVGATVPGSSCKLAGTQNGSVLSAYMPLPKTWLWFRRMESARRILKHSCLLYLYISKNRLFGQIETPQ